MKRELRYLSYIIIVILTFSCFIYPTVYKFTTYDNGNPLKINRITGKAYILTTGDGWQELPYEIKLK